MEKKIRIGVFGCWRGTAVAKCLKLAGADIVAACDKKPERLEKIKPYLTEDAGIYDNFDDFIEHDMDACLVTNYYHEHAPYASAVPTARWPRALPWSARLKRARPST